ncbi:helix-turn-helix transcriptional regulator [Pontibacter sp. Tf4]|uniref:helix-turn-helix domain-containing protein n=1 Tax=Pontibacter sp. Tf4 TaxID=2761620 RepID=UPI0016286523|nr:helix-turn-helix transcriptional regulator [Pontibacter sp. Tf4]MBB6610507.1 helix-turn-helix transcriptional regulator [Pontibacter sp. Tf4]
MENLHLKIKALRKEEGRTQEQVATVLGMTKGNLSRMEKGEVAISPERLSELAAYFGKSVEELAAYETLEEKVTKEERQDALSEMLRQRDERIRRMQQAAENYLYGLLGNHLIDETAERLKGKKNIKPAAERVWDTPGIEHLLNGENTSENFPMLEPFRVYRELKAKEKMKGFMEAVRAELGLSPDDPDPM